MKATRPGEFICFCPIAVPTKDGEGHIFLAIDAYSDFVLNTGVEDKNDEETILKHIYLLTEHPDFKENMTKGFTLVLHDFHDLASKIKSIIEPRGKILFDEDYHKEIRTPAITSLFNRLAEK